MHMPLPAEVGFRSLDGFRQRSRVDRERRLAGAVLVTGIVAVLLTWLRNMST
jgi:hypothetical protein